MGYPFRSGQASCARMRSGSVGPWRGGSRGPARTRPRAPGRCRRVGARHSPRRAVVRGNGVGKNLSQMDKPFVEYLLDSSVRSLAGDMSHQSPLSRSGLTRSRAASPHLRPTGRAHPRLACSPPKHPLSRERASQSGGFDTESAPPAQAADVEPRCSPRRESVSLRATNSSLIASVTPLNPPGVSEANASRQPDHTRRAVE